MQQVRQKKDCGSQSQRGSPVSAVSFGNGLHIAAIFLSVLALFLLRRFLAVSFLQDYLFPPLQTHRHRCHFLHERLHGEPYWRINFARTSATRLASSPFFVLALFFPCCKRFLHLCHFSFPYLRVFSLNALPSLLLNDLRLHLHHRWHHCYFHFCNSFLHRCHFFNAAFCIAAIFDFCNSTFLHFCIGAFFSRQRQNTGSAPHPCTRSFLQPFTRKPPTDTTTPSRRVVGQAFLA